MKKAQPIGLLTTDNPWPRFLRLMVVAIGTEVAAGTTPMPDEWSWIGRAVVYAGAVLTGKK